MRPPLTLTRHRFRTLALACASIALLAGLLPVSAAARIEGTPDGSGASSTSSPDPTVAAAGLHVRWASVEPVPLAGPGRVTFRFRTSGTQDGGRVLARIATLEGESIRELSTGSAVLGPIDALRWDGRDEAGAPVPNGVYTVRLVALSRTGAEQPSSIRRFRVERPTQTRTIYRVNGAGRRVALTFDDCNFDDVWRQILAALAKTEAQATFFCLGKTVQLFPRLARQTVALGHDIGSHSFDHPDLRYASEYRILDELDRTTRSWWSIAGVTPIPYFRPPYGDFDDDVLRALGARGYTECVLWDVDPSDWTDPGPMVIAQRVLTSVRPGSIVLLHVKPQTAAALPLILRGLEQLRLRPVTLTELIAAGAAVTEGDVTLPY